MPSPQGVTTKGMPSGGLDFLLREAKAEGVDLLIIFRPDSLPKGREVREIVGPIREGKASLTVGVPARGGSLHLLSTLLLRPLLAGLFSILAEDPLPPLMALSGAFLQEDVHEPLLRRLGRHGAPFQILLQAIIRDRTVVEVPGSYPSREIEDPPVIRKVLKTALNEVYTRSDQWLKRVGSPLQGLPRLPAQGEGGAFSLPNPRPFLRRFVRGFNRLYPLFQRLMPEEGEELRRVVDEGGGFSLDARLWARIVYRALLSLSDPRPFTKGDLFNAITVAFFGRAASFVHELWRWREKLKEMDRAEEVLAIIAEGARERETEAFLGAARDFAKEWEKKKGPKPPPQVTYREYVPGVGLVFPHEVRGLSLEGVFRGLVERRREAFWGFVEGVLGLREGSSSREILEAV
ncbi:MAG: hypothetical protein DRG33_05860, partial [Deltaproteobacteria bacterium]